MPKSATSGRPDRFPCSGDSCLRLARPTDPCSGRRLATHHRRPVEPAVGRSRDSDGNFPRLARPACPCFRRQAAALHIVRHLCRGRHQPEPRQVRSGWTVKKPKQGISKEPPPRRMPVRICAYCPPSCRDHSRRIAANRITGCRSDGEISQAVAVFVRPPAGKTGRHPHIAAARLAPGVLAELPQRPGTGFYENERGRQRAALRRAAATRESLRCDERGRQLRRPASKIDLKSNQSKSKERLKATDPNEQQGARHDWIHGPSPRG
jgi:hypothetical protein